MELSRQDDDSPSAPQEGKECKQEWKEEELPTWCRASKAPAGSQVSTEGELVRRYSALSGTCQIFPYLPGLVLRSSAPLWLR